MVEVVKIRRLGSKKGEAYSIYVRVPKRMWEKLGRPEFFVILEKDGVLVFKPLNPLEHVQL